MTSVIKMMRVSIVLSLMLLLGGCWSSNPVITKTIRETVPEAWLVPVESPMQSGITWGQYAARCEAVVKQCNIDKAQIGEWSNASANP